MHMPDDDVESDKGGSGLPELYAWAIGTGGNDDNRPVIEQEIINEQTNDLYCGQASSTMGFPGSTYNCNRNEFLKQVAPMDGALREPALT